MGRFGKPNLTVFKFAHLFKANVGNVSAVPPITMFVMFALPEKQLSAIAPMMSQ